jgi:O-6-methylguanine DNA methyltransferase
VVLSRFLYPVDGWGVGELVVAGGRVAAHDLPGPDRALPATGEVSGEFGRRASAGAGRRPVRSRADLVGARLGPPPPKGDASPPGVTLATEWERVCDDFVPNLVVTPRHGQGRAAPGGNHAFASRASSTRGQGGSPPNGDAELVADVVARVRQHLAGGSVDYADLPLDLSWCTPFQARLAAALRAVPWGEVVSYGELAALAGRPGAARAAGTFCANNAFALIVPCHRVVAATGIGGYGSSGVQLKRRLLALEGVRM